MQTFFLFDISRAIYNSNVSQIFHIKVLKKILQNSLDDTFARVSLLIKLQTSSLQFIEKETPAQMGPVNFATLLRATFFSPARLLLNIYSPNNLSVCSTKDRNCLGRSIKLDDVNIEKNQFDFS